MNKERVLIIKDARQGNVALKWVRGIILCSLITLGPVGLGVWADSPAMQWVGFVMTFIVFITVGKMMTENKEYRVTTKSEAEKALNEIFEARGE